MQAALERRLQLIGAAVGAAREGLSQEQDRELLQGAQQIIAQRMSGMVRTNKATPHVRFLPPAVPISR